MKYLKSYQPFLESNGDQEIIDMFKSVDQLTKNKNLSQQDQEKIAKELGKKIENNPKISKEIKDVEQKLKSETITNEAHGGLMLDFIHKIEYAFEMGEHIETAGHDIFPHVIHSEVKSKIKKAWSIIYNILHTLAKSVGWLFDLFEKAIMWVANKIFGATLDTAYKIGKWTFCAISFTIVTIAVISIGAITGATSILGFIISIFTKWDALMKLKSIAQSIWSFIKKVLEIDKSESGELFTPVEFFSSLSTSILEECPDINTSTQKDLQVYFDSQQYKTKNIISNLLKDLIDTEDIKKWQKAGLQPYSKNSVLKNDLKLKKIKDIPFLRKLFLPILLSDGLIPSGKVDVFKNDDVDTFARKISGKLFSEFGDSPERIHLKNTFNVMKNRYGKNFTISYSSKELADKLHTAMDGAGTYEDDIYEVFQKINNELEFWQLYFAFGLRSKSDLIEWLFGDLESEELVNASRILSKIDWKEGFNVSDILKGKLIDYHKELPKWSLSRKKIKK